MKNCGNVSEIAIFAHNIRVSWPSLYYRSHVQTFAHFRHLYLSGNGPVAFVQVDRAGCITAEIPVVSQSNLPKPRQTRKRAGAAPASASTSTSERAVTADASHISTTGVADIVKAVMSEMEPLFEKTIKAAVATAIEAMLPQLEASIAAENDRLTKEVGHLRSALQSQAFELDRLAQYSRRENVRLHGVPETADENTNDVVIAIASDMGVRIDEHDICVSHRLQKSRSMQERPIIVRFVRRDTKIEIMRKKKTLRTIDSHRNTFINDDLTPLRSKSGNSAIQKNGG